MRIGKILYPVTTLGRGSRLGIWVQGCNRFCEGCSNPELQTFDDTKEVPVEKIFDGVKDLPIDGVTFSGGEPFLQTGELRKLIDLFKTIGCTDVLVYTGFTMEELVTSGNADVDYVLSNISVLIDGPFVKSKVDDIPLRGSKNQVVWVIDRKYESDYRKILASEKKVEVFRTGDEVHFIGIPFKDYEKLYIEYVKKV